MSNVNVKVNGVSVSVPAGSNILTAARAVGVDIPTLCYMKERNEIGACRICLVEASEGGKPFRQVAACVYPVSEGMEIKTNTPKIISARKMTLELILSNHKKECLSCVRSGSCELQKLAHDYGVDEYYYQGEQNKYPIDDSAVHMIRDNNKCILCRRCVAACKEQHVGVIGANDRGFDTHIGCAFDLPLAKTGCISCGQCIVNCPTGALTERDDTAKVMAALNDPEKFVVVQTAPSIRATLGECFDMPIGTIVTGKMVSALRMLGFDKVFDTNFSADLTIMEEGTEFIGRVKNGGVLPMITSCSPGWIKFCETYHPEYLPNLSTCKSPQQMFGAVTKTYYAEKMGLDPKNIVVVSIMPCTAKKFEVGRADQNAAGVPDVDFALTTRELGRMIATAHINFQMLPDGAFDAPLGEGTGAATIFGATGGVMEAALRTVAEVLEGKVIENIEYTAVRGTQGIKEATLNIAGMDVKVAVCSGMENAHQLLEKINRGEATYHFIEIMGCPGGCVNGGGQPIQPASVRNFVDLKGLRAAALYEDDKNLPHRKSHENVAVQTLYKEYLGEPNSHKAHEILHTSYVDRSKDVIK